MSANYTNKEFEYSKQDNEQNSIEREGTTSQNNIPTQPYTDYSASEEIPIGAKEAVFLEQYNENLIKGPFPFKLHIVLKVLDQEGSHDIISWNSHGRSFIIKNQHKFEAEVMPRFFKTNQLPSFRRQLNLYKFVRVNEGPESGSYYHELFLRTKPLLSLKLERLNRKGPDSSKQVCPNFQAMKILPKLVHVVPLSMSKAPPKVTNMGIGLHGSGLNTHGQSNPYGIDSSRPVFGMNLDRMGANLSGMNLNALGTIDPSGMTVEQQLLQLAQNQIPFQQMQLTNALMDGNNMNYATNLKMSLNELQRGFLGESLMNNGGNNLANGIGMNNTLRMLGIFNNSTGQTMMNMNNVGNNINVGVGGINNMMINMRTGAMSDMMENTRTMMSNIGGGTMNYIDGRMSNNVPHMLDGNANNMRGMINNVLVSRLNNFGPEHIRMISSNQYNVNPMIGSDISNRAFVNSNQLQMPQQQIPWNTNMEFNAAPLTLPEQQQLMMLQQLENASQNSSYSASVNSKLNHSSLKESIQQSDSSKQFKNDISNVVDKKRKSNDNGDEIIPDGLGSYLRRRGRRNSSSVGSMDDYEYEKSSCTSSKKQLDHETVSSQKSSKSRSGMHDLTMAALKIANVSFPSDIGSSRLTVDVKSDELNVAKTSISTLSEKGSEIAIGSFQRRFRVPTNANCDTQKEGANNTSR